jgi:3-hydroxyacyl-[acyl-carrier-protein] dehydratase
MRWMWIDRVLEIERSKRLVAIKLVSRAEEHLLDHFPADVARGLPAQPVMPACLILEGMAQTGGILVGHAHDFAFNVVLAKISKAEIGAEATPGCVLRYTAMIERMDAVGASVLGTIELSREGDAEFATIGQTEMMFSHLDNNQGQAGQAGVDFPAGNFVFGESFRTLLDTSGVGLKG